MTAPKNPACKAFGDALRKAMQDAGFSYRDLAARLKLRLAFAL